MHMFVLPFETCLLVAQPLRLPSNGRMDKVVTRASLLTDGLPDLYVASGVSYPGVRVSSVGKLPRTASGVKDLAIASADTAIAIASTASRPATRHRACARLAGNS